MTCAEYETSGILQVFSQPIEREMFSSMYTTHGFIAFLRHSRRTMHCTVEEAGTTAHRADSVAPMTICLSRSPGTKVGADVGQPHIRADVCLAGRTLGGIRSRVIMRSRANITNRRVTGNRVFPVSPAGTFLRGSSAELCVPTARLRAAKSGSHTRPPA
jgi:hypothetical protein